MSQISDTIITSFQEYLINSRASHEPSKKEKKFYLSDLGKCYRTRWLKRKGIQGTYTWKTYYTFAHGDFIHKLGYQALEAKGILKSVEQASENEHFSWRYDGTIEIEKKEYLFDFKSTNPYIIKKLVANGADNVENIFQILGGIILEKQVNNRKIEDVGIAVYVNKLPTNNKMLQAPEIIVPKEYHLNIYKDEIMEDMNKMIKFWLDDVIPPCTCPSWSSQEYNSYYLFCHMSEKELKTYLKQLKTNMISSDGYTITVKKLDGKEDK